MIPLRPAMPMPARALATVVAAVALTLPAVRPAAAQAPPAAGERPTRAQLLTGAWELDLAQSEFGPMPRPSAMTRRLQVTRASVDMTIAQTTPQGAMTGTFRCAIGGATCRNAQGSSQTTGSARWERGVLVVTTTLSRLLGPDLTTVDRYLTTEDGRTLTMERTFESGGVASASKGRLVFRRQ